MKIYFAKKYIKQHELFLTTAPKSATRIAVDKNFMLKY